MQILFMFRSDSTALRAERVDGVMDSESQPARNWTVFHANGRENRSNIENNALSPQRV